LDEEWRRESKADFSSGDCVSSLSSGFSSEMPTPNHPHGSIDSSYEWLDDVWSWRRIDVSGTGGLTWWTLPRTHVTIFLHD
jgi:hypothetical protein